MKLNKIERKIATTDSIKHKVRESLLTHSYQQTTLGQITAVLCATLIFSGLYTSHNDNNQLIAWYIIFLLIVLARIASAGIYLSQRHSITHFNLWKYVSFAGALFSGLTWGFVGSFLFGQSTMVQQILIILVLSGLTAGAAPLLAAELFTSITFISAVLLPLIYELYYLGASTANGLYAFTAIIYLSYLIILSFKLHHMIKRSITLRFDNDSLLENLSFAKRQLEIINQKLAIAATHDPLTHLANRDLFQHKLNNAIEKCKDTDKLMTVFYIDLDNFKMINDRYGHQIGDQLLLKVVDRLQKNVRQYDLVSRLGGDELTIIFENISEVDSINALAIQLTNALAKPLDIQNNIISVTASIGISICPLDGSDVDTLLNAADTAMYTAKKMGRNNFRFYSEAMNEKFLIPSLPTPITPSN